jgi:hypothetical protein
MIDWRNLPGRLKRNLLAIAEEENKTPDQVVSEIIIQGLDSMPLERRKPENSELRSLYQAQQQKPA